METSLAVELVFGVITLVVRGPERCEVYPLLDRQGRCVPDDEPEVGGWAGE